MPSISCVVLNYGNNSFVPDCIESLHRTSNRPDIEIIMVDNGSAPEDLARLTCELRKRGTMPDSLIERRVNDGFAAGMNAGISASRGDVVIAINSDTIVGAQLLPAVARAAKTYPDAGFLSTAVYHAPLQGGRLQPGEELQADAVALTCYCSCMPVEAARISPRFILGPPGCFVAMSRRLIEKLTAVYGCVYDPHFFLYGEDVDLFLRARRCGFEVRQVDGTPSSGSVVWHAGSGSTAEGTIQTVRKSPKVAAMILRGFWGNGLHHASYLELPLVTLFLALFTVIFWVSYARANSLSGLLELICTERLPRPQRTKVARGMAPWLLPQIALMHNAILPWARARLPWAGTRQKAS